MGAWDDLKGSLFAAGRDVSQKAKEVSEIAKIKMDIRTKEDLTIITLVAIAIRLNEIGRAVII